MKLSVNLSSSVHGPPEVREALLRTRLDSARHLLIALLVLNVAYMIFLVVVDLSK